MLSFSARFLQPCAKALHWSAAANPSVDGEGETRVKHVLEAVKIVLGAEGCSKL